MGWLWWSPGQSDDAYSDLSPDVRHALQKESPSGRQARSHSTNSESQHTTLPPSTERLNTQRAPDHFRAQAGFVTAQDTTNNSKISSARVPEQSLFRDGRYAHLWKSYESPNQVETETVSHDMLGSVIDTHRERQAQISRAALENCVFYQIAERECLEKGSIRDRLTMCGKQSQASNRCYTMQTRFLRALGYAASGTLGDDHDRIQLHSENLYNEILERERLVKETKESGLPEPSFASLFRKPQTSEAGVAASQQQQQQPSTVRTEALALLGPEKLRLLDEKLGDISHAEKEVELSLAISDYKTSLAYTRQVNSFFEQEKSQRDARLASGKPTFGDSLKKIWGWN